MPDPTHHPAGRRTSRPPVPGVTRAHSPLQRWRRGVQYGAAALFVALSFGLVNAVSWDVANVFFVMDPLVGLTAMLSARTLVPVLLFGSVVTLLATLALGRVWCGWICPVGTLLDLVPTTKKPIPMRGERWLRGLKYVFLIVIFIGAATRTLTLMWLDPITIMGRTLAVGIEPIFETRDLAMPPPEFSQLWPSILVLVVFGLIIALNAIRSRFWCRYLCPLGALLAVFSRFAWLKPVVQGSTCISCSKCARGCSVDAVSSQDGYSMDSAECVMCMECEDACPTHAVSFSLAAIELSEGDVGPTRREFVGVAVAAGAMAAGAAVAPSRALASVGADIPPLATRESLVTECVRCGRCSDACPFGLVESNTAILEPDTLFTPRLNRSDRRCTENCNLCGLSCPTEAIPVNPVPLVAEIRDSECMAWLTGVHCSRCVPVCPVPGAVFDAREAPDAEHLRDAPSELPWIDPGKCIGCGLCLDRCPGRFKDGLGMVPRGQPQR